MEMYNGILCISGRELIQTADNPRGIVPKGTYDAWVTRKKVAVLRRGCRETPALIAFDSLPAKYQALAYERFGNPQVAAEREGIMRYVEADAEAARWFAEYRYPSGDELRSLPEEVQQEYCRVSAVLRGLGRAWDRHVLESRGRGKRPMAGKFWQRATEAVQGVPAEWACQLPKNAQSLRRKYDDYVREGYEAILSGKWGNTNTQKITEEAGNWLVARWSSPVSIVTIEQLHRQYNLQAKRCGWKPLKSEQAVRDYLHRPEVEERWWAARYGELAYKEKFTRQHRTLLANLRDSLWYSDGTKLNLYYQDERGSIRTTKVYEVMDVYSEVLLGYHISDSEDYEAQYHAFKMAVRRAGHKPYEVRFDNQGGHKRLENGGFMNTLTRHAIKTQPYNGKSKTIESVFGRLQNSYLHNEWFFTGQNITAKKNESKARKEFILANAKQLPTLEEVKALYAEKREEWNNAPHPKGEGKTRWQMYCQSVNPETERVDVLDMITMFGITTDKPATYRSNGIQIEVKRKKYAYEVMGADGLPSQEFLRANVGRKFHIRYDLEDMSIVSLYEQDAQGRMRFVCAAETYRKVQRNLQEQLEDDKAFIRQMEWRNKVQRVDNAKQLNELLAKYDLHPNQHGLNAPKPKGLNMRGATPDIGEVLKRESDAMELEAPAVKPQPAKTEKPTKRQLAAAQEQARQEEDDFYEARMRELMKALND